MTAVSESLIRIGAMFLRYLYLHKRSLSRTLDILFWPVMELLVWGFVTLYIQSVAHTELGRIIVFLISAIIFWDLLYRGQLGISVSVVEDIWTNNIVNLLISPLRLWEWLTATFLYGLVKTLLITVILAALAVIFYRFNLVDAMGFSLIPLSANILFFGWTLGVFTSGLLIRWGHSVEALIWGIPFLIQPISAIYYPLSTLPLWLQGISKGIPSTYVFEGMRTVVGGGAMPWNDFWKSLGLNLVYFLLSCFFFAWMYHRSRLKGRLGKLGMD